MLESFHSGKDKEARGVDTGGAIFLYPPLLCKRFNSTLNHFSDIPSLLFGLIRRSESLTACVNLNVKRHVPISVSGSLSKEQKRFPCKSIL